MKKSFIKLSVIALLSLSATSNVVAQDLGSILNLNQDKVALALKEALENGIDKQVVKLTAQDGFYKNELVKILLPEEAQRIDRALRSAGMGKIADQGLLVLNRAAEEAVKEATPIFIDAVKNITFNDAKNILLDGDHAATDYLQTATKKSLYAKFSPVIQNSFEIVGADKVWNTIFTSYNALPLVTPVNIDITDYATEQTMAGVFKMIAVEEENIRSNFGGSRNTQTLKDVFGSLDNTKKKETSGGDTSSKNEEKGKKVRGLLKGLNLSK